MLYAHSLLSNCVCEREPTRCAVSETSCIPTVCTFLCSTTQRSGRQDIVDCIYLSRLSGLLILSARMTLCAFRLCFTSYNDIPIEHSHVLFMAAAIRCTRVGTLIVATIYLQLIQNRYMFRSFTVLQCSHQHCVQPCCQRRGSRRIPLVAPVVLIVRMERSTASRISGTVLKRMPRSGSFILGIKWKSQGLKPL